MWKSNWIKLFLPVGSKGKHCSGGTDTGEGLGPYRKNYSVNFSVSFLKFSEGNQCRSRSAKKKCKLQLFSAHSSHCSSGRESQRAQAAMERCLSPKESRSSNPL